MLQAIMTDPKLVELFRDEACFTLDEAEEATGKSRDAILKQIEYLQREGYVENARRGLYALVTEKSGSGPPDPLLVASKLVEPYLLAYHSALELHGVAESAFFDTVYVASPNRFTAFEWGQRSFRRVAIARDVLDAGDATTKRSGRKLHVSCRELTLIQCLDRPEYAGGFSEVLSSLGGFPYLDWGRLLDLLELHGKTTLYRKVGYVIEANADRWRPPEAVARILRDNLGEGSTYFGVGPNQGGRHEARWQVIVPPDAPAIDAED